MQLFLLDDALFPAGSLMEGSPRDKLGTGKGVAVVAVVKIDVEAGDDEQIATLEAFGAQATAVEALELFHGVDFSGGEHGVGGAYDLGNEREKVGAELVGAVHVGRNCLSKKEMVPIEKLADWLRHFGSMRKQALVEEVACHENLACAAYRYRAVLILDYGVQAKDDALVARAVAQLIVHFDHDALAAQEEKDAAARNTELFDVPAQMLQ